MKAEYVSPFVESVSELFETMLGIEAKCGEPGPSDDPGDKDLQGITALVGLSGPVRGTVALGFPATTAIAIVNRLLSIEATGLDDMVVDGVAEVVNIIAGSAKPRLARADGPPVELGLPTVVQGRDYMVRHPSETVVVEVPFTSELGELSLRLTFEKMPEEANVGGVA